MTKYKRWILLLTALTAFAVNVESLKATSLIHAGKFNKQLNLTTTTTSTTEGPPKDEKEVETLKETPKPAADEEVYVEFNGTKIALTGIPQIDYQWDPNLPRELNGANLSSYPFLDSLPAEEDIGFDCEEKINGFYASIKFGCQLYHHCLYGARSDFMCANFTAFDQKTFICHFASEVDCKNSYKYWNRNDDLYKATTEKPSPQSSGSVPLIDRNLYRRPAPGSANNSPPQSNRSPPQQNNNNNKDPPLANSNNPAPPPLRNSNINDEDYVNPPAGQRTPNRPLRRPYRRRRPQIDYYYYDDDYEDEQYNDRGRRRQQQRPRNRRPIYDDYDNRRPYADRENRRPYNDDFDDDYDQDRRPYRNRNRSESRRNGDDRRKTEDRKFDDRRRPYNDDERKVEDRRRPQQDERRSYEDKRERLPEKSERGEQSEKREAIQDPQDDKPLKPAGSIFDRPRPSPKINRFVPLSEKNKPSTKTTTEAAQDEKSKEEDYYEEYDDAPASSTTTTSTTTPKPSTKFVYSPRLKTPTTQQTTRKPSTTTAPQEFEYYDDEYYDATPAKPESSTFSKTHDRAALFNNRNRNSNDSPTTTTASTVNRLRGLHDKLSAFHEKAQTLPNIEPRSITTPSSTTTTTRRPLPSNKKFANQQTVFDGSTTETPKAQTKSVPYNQRFTSRTSEQPVDVEPIEEKDQKSVLRVIKRPFLPSRGGNPYKARGLQPVGPQDTSDAQFTAPGSELMASVNSNPLTDSSQETFAKSSSHKTTLDDIYNEEYDVELNDALNPMLKPLTSSRGISGFSFSSLPNADDRDGFRSQSQKSIQRAEAPKTSTTTEAPQYDYEEVEYDYK